MKKISLESAKKLLSALQVDVEVVADEKEADKDLVIDDIVAEAKETINADAVATLDKTALEEHGKKSVGQLLDTLRSQMAKNFGGTQNEYRGADKTMTIQEIVALAKTKYDERTGQQAKDWEKEREELMTEHEAAIEKQKAEYEGQVNAERNKYIERDISAATLSMLEKIPRKGGDLADDADTLLYKARQQYDIKYNEAKKEMEWFVKGTDKPAPVKPADFAKQWIEKSGRLATDTRHLSPKDVINQSKNGQQPVAGILPKEPTEKQIPQSQEDIYSWANQE